MLKSFLNYHNSIQIVHVEHACICYTTFRIVNDSKGVISMVEMNAIELLRHARHDWMNKIQLIKGYLSLGNLERLEAVVNDIVKDAENDSRLSNINLPNLVSYILTYNWKPSTIVLKFDVLGEGQLPLVDDLIITEWFKKLMDLLESGSTVEVENELYLRINLDFKLPSFNIQYKGILTNKEFLETYISATENVFKVAITEFNEETIRFDIHF